MKQKISIQVLALLLAVSTFTASVGLAVDIHFCKNTIKNVSFFGVADDCMTAVDNGAAGACSNPSKVQPVTQTQVSKTPCCNNHTFFSKIDIASQHQTATQQHSNFTILSAVVSSTIGIAVFSTCTQSNTGHYSKSPPLSKDFAVLYQTFRI